MTRNYYTTENYNVDNSTFGGMIYKGDFDMPHSLADITQRIMSDIRFDKECCKKGKERYKKKENN